MQPREHNAGIAVFDLDGTLTSKDTFLEFLKYEGGTLKFLACFVLLSPAIISYYLKILPNYRLKEFFFSFFFKGKEVRKVEESGRKFSDLVLPSLLFPKVDQIFNWHRSKGHRIIILSASSSIWLKKWCENWEFELIGTEFESKSGIYTGRIKGKNCFGEEKRKRIEPFFNKYAQENRFAYGDSKSDLHFLNLANQSYLFPLKYENHNKLQHLS